jgi:RNA polymerase sigma-70 factor, ECF subfamily
MGPASNLEARFDEIVRLHGAPLRRLARAYAATDSDADDLFQEICFALWRALPGFRGECSDRTFAFRIGHNRGLTFRHRQRVQPVELPDSLEAREPGPDTLATRAIRRDRLFDAVRALPEGHRRVVLLSLEGLSQAEIGDVLGISENNVAVRLNRAKKTLRAALGTEGGDG